MIYFKKIIFLFTFILLEVTAFSQGNSIEQTANTLELFSRFVEWPNLIEADNKPFEIGVFKNEVLFKSLNIAYSSKTIKKRKVEIKNITNLADIKNIQILFLTQNAQSEIDDIVKAISNKPILTISDSKDMVEKGIQLYFYYENETTKRVINQEAVDKSGLVLRYYLFQNAKIIKNQNNK